MRCSPLPSLPLLLALLLLPLLLLGPGPVASAAETRPSGVWPLDPRPEVVAGFDPPLSDWGSGHRGVDLAGRPGHQVVSSLPGRVTFVGRIAGRGVVVVDHGATRTTYEPVSASVARGVRVAAGARLGVLDLTGSHCFPLACLHWGWLRGSTYLDPLLLVGGGPVRLLPLFGSGWTGSAGWTPPQPVYAGWRPVSVRPWGVPAGRRDATGRW